MNTFAKFVLLQSSTRVAGVLQFSLLPVLTDTSARERLCDAVCLDLPEPRKCFVAPFARGMLAAPERFQCKELNQELTLGSLTHHQDKMLLCVSRASDYKELTLEVFLPCMS